MRRRRDPLLLTGVPYSFSTPTTYAIETLLNKDHIEAISPAFVIVSAPKQSESRHDHPHDDAIDLYEEYAEVLHMGPKRECFICDIHEDGTIDDPVSDDGKLVESYGLSDEDDGDDGDGGNGGGGGGKTEKRGPFVTPTGPAAPRDGRYA